MQMTGNSQTAIASHGDERINSMIAEIAEHLVGEVYIRDGSIRLFDLAMKWIAAIGGSEDGAAEVRDFAHHRTAQFNDATLRI